MAIDAGRRRSAAAGQLRPSAGDGLGEDPAAAPVAGALEVVAEILQVVVGETAAAFQERGEFRSLDAEGFGGGDQGGMAIERVEKGGVVGDVLAGGRPRAKVGVGFEDLAATRGEGGDGIAVDELECVLPVVADESIDLRGAGRGVGGGGGIVRPGRARLPDAVVVRGLFGR